MVKFVSLSLLDQVYGLVIRFGHTSDVYVTSSVINMYSKYGSVDLARRMFDESLNKNMVCRTSLINGYYRNGLVVEARDVFDSIPKQNDVSCSAMISGVLNACAAIGALKEGKWIHDIVRENGFKYDLELGPTLIDFYAKCGCIEDVCEVFEVFDKMSCKVWVNDKGLEQ
ncbi:hypothetical protein QYF36_019465 [Acer negundo]|nr:hypothetical protein QYF36_019465 [Acer negundo]